jgi:hypothetical protein
MTEIEAALVDKKFNQKVLELCTRFHKGEKGKILLVYNTFYDAVEDIILKVTGKKIAKNVKDLEDVIMLITFRNALAYAIFGDEPEKRDWKTVNVSEIKEAKKVVLANSLEIKAKVTEEYIMNEKIDFLKRKLGASIIINIMLVIETLYLLFAR